MRHTEPEIITDTMDSRKRAAIEFSLHWQSPYASHNDRFFIDKVDFWRDIFPGNFGAALSEMEVGHIYSQRFSPGALVAEYSTKNLISFTGNAIKGSVADNLTLEVGRFYPRGLFWKPVGSFPADLLPVKLVHLDETSLTIDVNHPLAGYELEVEARVRETSSISAQRGGSLHDLAEVITEKGPGMQDTLEPARYTLTTDYPLKKDDESDDALFYRAPRLVHHLDSTARQQVSALYGRLLKPKSRILDLMSSWESHLPDSLSSCRVEGLGLNEQELQANGRLSEYLIHNLNRQPLLPYQDGSFDGVVCTVSLEYLCRPQEVIAELARILKPGGLLAVTISERWFPGKQVHPWADLHPFERLGGVINYFLEQERFENINTETVRGYPRPVDDNYRDQMDRSDPLYFVWATVKAD